METKERSGKLSEGIQVTIELLESLPVRGKDIETTGTGIMTAIKNLRVINDIIIKAENGELDNLISEGKAPDIQIVPEDEEGGAP